MGAPVHCHADEVIDAEGDAAIAPYIDISQLPGAGALDLPALLRRWDGGAVKIDGTVSEGEEVAGFRVIHFPGHAPGLIGLWRESDRWRSSATSSTWSIRHDWENCRRARQASPIPPGAGTTQKAKESVRKLAALEPVVVGAGHERPLRVRACARRWSGRPRSIEPGQALSHPCCHSFRP